MANTFDPIPHVKGGSVTDTFAQMNGLVNHNVNNRVKTQFMHNHQQLETALEYQETGISYIFMTRPDLNANNSDNGGFWDKMKGKIEFYNLTSGACGNFIPILSNMYTSISLEDYNSTEGSYGTTYRGFTQKLPLGAGQSKGGGGTFSITYNETADSSVTKIHKLWFDYIENVKFGAFSPQSSYISSRSIDYVAALYFFNVRPDGHTISMWGKYTGVTPQNVPYSAFGGDVGNRGLVQLTCSYLYNFKEYMNPAIIEEFNSTSGGGGDTSSEKAFSSSVGVGESGGNYYLMF